MESAVFWSIPLSHSIEPHSPPSSFTLEGDKFMCEVWSVVYGWYSSLYGAPSIPSIPGSGKQCYCEVLCMDHSFLQ